MTCSLSHRSLRFGCLAGTFSPSRRQIRSTRFSFTCQAARHVISFRWGAVGPRGGKTGEMLGMNRGLATQNKGHHQNISQILSCNFAFSALHLKSILVLRSSFFLVDCLGLNSFSFVPVLATWRKPEKRKKVSGISSGLADARGVKRLCASCALPFYDLARTPIICPNCSQTFEPPPVVPRRTEPTRAHTVGRTAPWTSQQSAQRPQPVAVVASAPAILSNQTPDEAKSTTEAVADDDDVLLELDEEIDDGDVESEDSDTAKDQSDN